MGNQVGARRAGPCVLSTAAVAPPCPHRTVCVCIAFLAVMTLWAWTRVIPPYIRCAALAGTSGALLRLHHILASLHIARRCSPLPANLAACACMRMHM